MSIVPAFGWVTNEKRAACPHSTSWVFGPCKNWCSPCPDTKIPRLDARFVANDNRVRPRVEVAK